MTSACCFHRFWKVRWRRTRAALDSAPSRRRVSVTEGSTASRFRLRESQKEDCCLGEKIGGGTDEIFSVSGGGEDRAADVAVILLDGR